MQRFRHACRALLGMLLAAACGAALAQQAAVAADAGEWAVPVDAATLDGMRGGFETPGGLSLSLGIERVISVNGEVLSRTNVAIADMAAMNADQLLQAREMFGNAQLIQLGGNNFAAADLGLGNAGTFIQNTLNDQQIHAQTTITSTVNSMSLIKDLNFHSTIRDAIVRSAGSL